MEGILNGVDGRDVLQIVKSRQVSKGSHELAPTRSPRGMEEHARNRDLGLPSVIKNVLKIVVSCLEAY